MKVPVGADTENADSDTRSERFADALREAGYEALTVKFGGSTVTLVDTSDLPLPVWATEQAARDGLRYARCTTEMYEEPGYVAYVPREVADR